MPRAARLGAGILFSALLAFVYARGGAAWMLGFVVLVPWLRTLDASRSVVGALLAAVAMAMAYTAAVFTWFGSAMGAYTQLGTATGLALLLLAAPVFQPQFLSFALVRCIAGRRYGRAVGAMAGAAAWVATESLVPRVLGDTLGYGLYPSETLRQAADLGGTAGLTLLLLLCNEGIAAAIAQRAVGVRAVAKPLALAVLIPLLLGAYGLFTLSAGSAIADKPLRMGLVQSNIVDYERLRREKGAAAVVREVLDTHYAMSYDAVERQGADAVLWSETVYPTTFAQPKSEAGAELDREIVGIVNAAGVPFVFGTYDRDSAGEYNAAAFVNPGAGLLGFYRKTRLFPLTEYVPAWLDSPTLRRWLPWTGTWRPGSGARVFPLRLADGREIPALPLICLDDMDAALSIEGARLGARVILTMSNDSWFSAQPQGAEWHQAAAAFRSIETRLPQFRVTNNGYSAVIDASGRVIASAGMGQRVLVMGELPVHEPPRTLMVAWGDWVGRASAVFLALLGAAAASTALARSASARSLTAFGLRRRSADATVAACVPLALPVVVAVLPPAARLAAGLLRGIARCSLLFIGAAVLLGDGALQTNTLAQMRTFGALFVVPELAAWLLLRAFSARASTDNGALVLTRGRRRLEVALGDIAAVEPWHMPIPGPGAWLRLTTGVRWQYGLAHADPVGLGHALAAAGGPRAALPSPTRAAAYARARCAIHDGRLAHPLVKFGLFPLALALLAFRMHQHIAYGSTLGEYYSFGATAYLTTLALWWAAWAMGMLVLGAALRAGIEAGTLMAVLMRPQQAVGTRRWLERLGLLAFYAGLPALLVLRLLLS
ncbi:MAG TPA: apolipoprotein N-acyltransferase [Rubrivivax sp.]|nr:apolipoprotein N-acyltransferase [Rubrivivax sp.]